MSGEEWGPLETGRRRRRWPWLLLGTLAIGGVAVVAVGVAGTTVVLNRVEDNIERVELPELDEVVDDQPRSILVVGSDSREGVDRDEYEGIVLGDPDDFPGSRSDTILLVTIPTDRSDVSVVSFPRDLLVPAPDGDGIAKLTEASAGSPAQLVEVIRSTFDVPINHYVEVSIPAFLATVDAVGGVEICLDDPLRDPNSGADLQAGCQQLDAVEALSYVRSRSGPQGDFGRIERQQTFLRALIARALDLRLLGQPGRLVEIADRVSESLTTDDQLSVTDMARLGVDLRSVAGGDVPMVTLPGSTADVPDDGLSKSFVIPYGPGIEAITSALRDGGAPAPRGDSEARSQVAVGVVDPGLPAAAEVVASTLRWGAFETTGLGAGGGIEVPQQTTVLAPAGLDDPAAALVAAYLGAPIEVVPTDLEVADGVDVVVVTGQDAAEWTADEVLQRALGPS